MRVHPPQGRHSVDRATRPAHIPRDSLSRESTVASPGPVGRPLRTGSLLMRKCSKERRSEWRSRSRETRRLCVINEADPHGKRIVLEPAIPPVLEKRNGAGSAPDLAENCRERMPVAPAGGEPEVVVDSRVCFHRGRSIPDQVGQTLSKGLFSWGRVLSAGDGREAAGPDARSPTLPESWRDPGSAACSVPVRRGVAPASDHKRPVRVIQVSDWPVMGRGSWRAPAPSPEGREARRRDFRSQ